MMSKHDVIFHDFMTPNGSQREALLALKIIENQARRHPGGHLGSKGVPGEHLGAERDQKRPPEAPFLMIFMKFASQFQEK